MAKKVVFIATDTDFHEEEFEYTFFPGFAVVQKQKSINSLFASIINKYPDYKVLEVSTKSPEPLGVELSAFNLKLNGVSVESIFQSSKVFVDGSQHDFLITYGPSEAKKYIKENAHIPLKCFRYQGQEYPLFPKSAFYDYIYIKALVSNKSLILELAKYNVFTDIEFNDKKSINCQARTCSIFAYLLKTNQLDKYLTSFDKFIEIYDHNSDISLF